ncbi:WD40-repeat-containing domain protein [Rhizoctonia solani]|nr:WD40-repeat-containing domain protein [Rhizoctonia solani]
MPDVDLGTQVFDLAFNPKHDIVYTGLLDGHIKAFSYDDEGTCTSKFDIRPTKKTARSLTTDSDGLELYSVSKDRSIHIIDTSTGKIIREQARAHDSAINRVTQFMSMLATGDDDGVVKLWDPRQLSPIRSYIHHFDFISDFLWLQDKKQLVTTSGDGTLSVIDVRSSKVEPFAHSEDQEDELLSIVSIKDGKKVAVGTQTGIIGIWNRSSGWGDCVDRIKGHPHSVDALATLSEDVIVTGSSDGLVRVVQVLPNKLLGSFTGGITDHGTFPIERLRTDRNGAWLGSASHDNVLKLTDVRDALVDSDADDSDADEGIDSSEEDGEEGGSLDGDSDSGSEQSGNAGQADRLEETGDAESGSESGQSETPAEPDSEPEPEPVLCRKRKKKTQLEGPGNKKGREEDGFFDEL